MGSVTRSQAVLLASFSVRMILALGITTVLGRVLSPAAFGFYTLVGTLFFLAHVLLDLGTGSLAAREIARAPQRERPLLEGLLGWRRVVGAPLGACVVGAGLLEEEPGRRLVMLGTAVLFVLMAPGALSVVFQVRQAQGGPAVVGVASQALVLLGSLLFAGLGMPGAAFAWLIVLREGINVGALWWMACRLLGYRPRGGLRGRGLRPFLGMALVQGLAVLVQTAYFHVDVLLVRSLRGEAELGAYAAAFRPVNILLMLPSVLMAPLLPVLSARVAGARGRYLLLVRGATRVLLGVGALGAVAGALLAPDLMALLYGGNYLEGPLSAVPALRWMCVAFFSVFATAGLVVGLLAARKERQLLRLAALGLGVNVAGNLVLVPVFGFVAAAFTTALTEVVVLVGALITFRRALGEGIGGPGWLPALAPGLVLAGVLAAAPGPRGLRAAVGIAAALLGCAVVLALPDSRRLREVLRGEGWGAAAGRDAGAQGGSG